MICPVCKIELGQVVHKDLRRCDSCSLLVKNPTPSPDAVKRNVRNFMLSACRSKAIADARIKKASGYMEKLEKFVSPGVMYDIGAAGGFVMKAAQDRGWEVHGNEISMAQINYAKATFGFDIEYGFVEDLELPTCDAIIMWHTLEHMMDPNAVIEQCHGKLNDKGCVHIQVPCKVNVAADYEPWHMVEFTEKALVTLLEKNKFEVKTVEKDKDNLTVLGMKYEEATI